MEQLAHESTTFVAGDASTRDDEDRLIVTIDPADLDGDDEADPIRRLLRSAVLVGVGLVVVQFLALLMVVITGLLLTRQETGVNSSALQKIGAAFSGHVSVPLSLSLLVAVALLAAPIASRTHRSMFEAARLAAGVAVMVLSVVIVVGTVLGVQSTVYFLPPLNHHLTQSQKWELAAYVTGTVGTALLALFAAVMTLPRSAKAGAST
jgi:hypothetical protein